MDLESLRAAHREGRRLKYLFFWGHRPLADGTPGPGCLSQWWPAPFVVEGVTYPTAEHFMMAGKARLFGDLEALGKIVAAPHPKAAKALGRRVRGFDEDRWRAARTGLVVEGNLAKFGQHADLAEFLLGTGGRILVEASPTDRIWGIGMGREDPGIEDPGQWRGLNLLGFALMEVREALRAGVGLDRGPGKR